MHSYNTINLSSLPSRENTFRFTDAVHGFLFPIEPSATPSASELQKKLLDLLAPVDAQLANSSIDISNSFFAALENVRAELYTDAYFFLQSDPAAASLEEVIITYPGFNAITSYRIAHIFVQAGSAHFATFNNRICT
jgi:serine O-acetyltransferase